VSPRTRSVSDSGSGGACGGLAGFPAHDRVDDGVGDAKDQQDRSRGVASVMQSTGPKAGGFQQFLPLVVVGVGVERFAGRRGRDIAPLHSQVAGEAALAVLLLAVLEEELHQLVGDADGPTSGAGLGVLGLPPDVDLLRAVPGLAPAAVAASVLAPGPRSAPPGHRPHIQGPRSTPRSTSMIVRLGASRPSAIAR